MIATGPIAAIEELATAFAERFPILPDGLRTVGREAEYPVVTLQGESADIRRIWHFLMQAGDLEPVYGAGSMGEQDLIVALQGADYSYAMEVGLGTVEINTRPCADLYEVQRLLEQAVTRLVHAISRFSWRLLAYGIQPVSPPTLRLMAPKQRYQSLYRAMGAQWLWYTVTASDQIQIGVSRSEMIPLLNLINLVTPVLIAFCANSPVHGRALSPYCSAREGRMADIYAVEHRHGMLERPFEDVVDFVRTLSRSTYLIERDDGQIIPSSRPFSAYLAEHGADLPAFLFHEHYIWNSARLRASYGTVEIRPACQQPWGEHMNAAALGLGLVESWPEIDAYIRESLGPEYWSIMQTYHSQVIRHGLMAPTPAPDFLYTILSMVEDGLRGRGRQEEGLLRPLWQRLERRLNPAQQCRIVFRSEGMRGLLDWVTVRPATVGREFSAG